MNGNQFNIPELVARQIILHRSDTLILLKKYNVLLPADTSPLSIYEEVKNQIESGNTQFTQDFANAIEKDVQQKSNFLPVVIAAIAAGKAIFTGLNNSFNSAANSLGLTTQQQNETIAAMATLQIEQQQTEQKKQIIILVIIAGAIGLTAMIVWTLKK